MEKHYVLPAKPNSPLTPCFLRWPLQAFLLPNVNTTEAPKPQGKRALTILN